ncbi:MAG: 16S rRNA (guanine(966)-N(2))-methyltransferase RsmD [Balneolaceae bacterium]
MRIITGKLKGRVIPVPDTGNLRPTSDRTKEGLFSVIVARRFFEGTSVLDLFAGSGNLGLEAISRGSDHVLFVDRQAEHIRQIEKTARVFKVDHQIQTRKMSVEQFLETPPVAYDFVFSDPPYDYFLISEMPDKIIRNGWLKADGWFILEHDKRHNFTNHAHCFYSKAYGRTIVSIFQTQAVDSDQQ